MPSFRTFALLIQTLCFVAFLSQECVAQTKGIVSGSGETLPLGANDTVFVWLTPSQMVGIGTSSPQLQLDVAEGIRVGYTAATCTSALYGALRYNTSNNRLQICHPMGWIEVQACFPTASGCSACN